MADFFTSIIDFINTIWSFVTTIIDGLSEGLRYVLSSTVLVTTLVGFMPAFATGCVLAVFGIAVTKFIVGR